VTQAPFAGAILSILLLRDPVTWNLGAAMALMGLGVWLHLTEHHVHTRSHGPIDHEHEHEHDRHHQHDHGGPVAPGTRHSHGHHHDSLTHSHEHFPDAHHRHGHR
jgi:ABC-type nickel/cobalt efflux system permease component RcnA